MKEADIRARAPYTGALFALRRNLRLKKTAGYIIINMKL